MTAHPLLDALEPVAKALGAALVAPEDVESGDVPLYWDGALAGGFRQAGLHEALERLLHVAEADAGEPLAKLSREAKQDVVRNLDRQGAFVIRHAVEEVADRLGVSRFTIYNYLNAIEGGDGHG